MVARRLELHGDTDGEELPKRTWQEGGRSPAQVHTLNNALDASSKRDSRSYFILKFTGMVILLL